jgi:hypothetical protein
MVQNNQLGLFGPGVIFGSRIVILILIIMIIVRAVGADGVKDKPQNPDLTVVQGIERGSDDPLPRKTMLSACWKILGRYLYQLLAKAPGYGIT